jgi:DNA-binding transcriptional LysR family regulator
VVLTPRLLLTHRAVVAAGTLRGAAETLGYSVSSVSHQLSTLEQEARQALWERAGRGVRPTPAGLVLAEHADRILDAIQNAETALDDVRHGRAGRLRVVSFHTAGESLLPSAIATLQRTLPGTSVQPVLDDTEGALRRLRAGEVEAVIVVEFYPRGEEPVDDLHRTYLFDDEYRILLHDGDPLVRRRAIDVADLAGADWIVTAGPHDYIRDATVNLCRRAGFTPRIVAEGDGFSVTQGYVSVGLGVALAPVLALGAIRRHVVVRRLRQPPPARYIWLLTRPALAEQTAHRALVAALREAARTHA